MGESARKHQPPSTAMPSGRTAARAMRTGALRSGPRRVPAWPPAYGSRCCVGVSPFLGVILPPRDIQSWLRKMTTVRQPSGPAISGP